MSNEQARADLSVRMNVSVGHHREQLVYGPQCQPNGHPKPSRSGSANYFLKSMDHERPEAFRSPAAVSVLLEMCQIGPKRPPLAITCPSFDCVSVILQRTFFRHMRKRVNSFLSVHGNGRTMLMFGCTE